MLLPFSATIEIIGVNPFVFVPENILQEIFQQVGKNKGSIPVRGSVNGLPYKQTLVRFKGHWRLYINTTMLKNSPNRIGEKIEISIETDFESREIAIPEKFSLALKLHPFALQVFEQLSPSRKKEIIRYLANLKSEATLEKNIHRAIAFLEGKDRFVGRDKP